MSRLSAETEKVKAWRRRLRSRWYGLLGRPDESTFWLVRSLPGMLPKDEVRFLYRVAATAPGPGDVAEVGSWMGKSTVTIARALIDAGRTDCRVWAIDHHVGSEEHADFIARQGSTLAGFERNVRSAGVRHLVEPLVMTTVPAAAELTRRGVRLRLAFIDGAHDEDSVRADLRALRPLMNPRALMAFHDCDPNGGAFPGVWRALESELLRGEADAVEHVGTLWVVRLRS